MQDFFKKLNSPFHNGWLLPFLLSLVLSAITFPQLNPVYANGIDPPLSWLFNTLIRGNLMLGKEIIFPHGPLAFLMYPLPEGGNLLIAMVVYFLAKGTFAFGFITATAQKNRFNQLMVILIAAILLSLLDFLLILTGIVVIGCYHFLTRRHIAWLLLVFVVSVVALYIKAFVGIVCISIIVPFFMVMIYEVIFEKRPALDLAYIPVVPALIFFTWFILYGTFQGVFRYMKGMTELAGDNSAAVAYYPDNNWWLLGLAICMSVGLFLLHSRDRLRLKIMIILLPSLFATWKYGMAREDYLHAGMLFQYLVFSIGFFLITLIHRRLLTTVAGVVIILLFFLNLRNVYYYEPVRLTFNGLGTLHNWIGNYEFHADTSRKASERHTLRNRLDPALRQLIGNSTADVFPWDYSFIPANRLNWQPRPVLQSYASYTPWLDLENARHFHSAKAPEFLIWELRKITHDIHDGTMESIDGRYLLNDQPEAMLRILSDYRLVKKQGGTFPVLLFQKRPGSLDIERKILQHDTVAWNQWFDVPSQAIGLQRLKAQIDRNTLGDLKSFLYKDEACFLYMLLENKEIRIFRIVPENAAQGLWVNPLIMNGENDRTDPLVTKVMFRNSNPGSMEAKIPVEWEWIRFQDEQGDTLQSSFPFEQVYSMFGKTYPRIRNQFLFSSNDLESEYPGWSANPSPDHSLPAYSGKTSCRLEGNTFSCAYEIPLDTLLKDSKDTSWLIRADCWALAARKCDASLVISIEKEHKPIAWKSVRVNDFMIERGEWNYVTNFLKLSREDLETGSVRLKVYAWNIGEQEIWVDDLRVIIAAY